MHLIIGRIHGRRAAAVEPCPHGRALPVLGPKPRARRQRACELQLIANGWWSHMFKEIILGGGRMKPGEAVRKGSTV